MLRIALALTCTLTAAPALASDMPLVGDPVNGRKLLAEACGAATARATLQASEMNAMLDGAMHAAFMQGQCVDSGQTFDASGMSFLDAWDMVAFVRTRHLRIADFFPEASRYLEKVYAIDAFGIERLKKVSGRTPSDIEHRVFTFFDFEGERGNLRFVPQDPILIDELARDKKSGYLVFAPIEYGDVRAEVGIATDASGVIRKALVHRTVDNAAEINAALEAFVGKGQIGSTDGLTAPRGNKNAAKLQESLSVAYQKAMEAATMFVREERDRTWSN